MKSLSETAHLERNINRYAQCILQHTNIELETSMKQKKRQNILKLHFTFILNLRSLGNTFVQKGLKVGTSFVLVNCNVDPTWP